MLSNTIIYKSSKKAVHPPSELAESDFICAFTERLLNSQINLAIVLTNSVKTKRVVVLVAHRQI